MSDKKLIIDEDWKSQVQAEKEAAKHTDEPASPGEVASATGNQSAERSGANAPPADLPDIEMPPASFELLLTTLATEALVALGQIPHPITGKAEPQRNQAKYIIDTIDVLKQKTKGNLTPIEEETIESLLHQLRMVFVQTA